jgi:hypothetical protein
MQRVANGLMAGYRKSAICHTLHRLFTWSIATGIDLKN